MAVRPYAMVVFGAFCTAMSLELFYIPHRLVDGGMTGLAVVIGRTMNVPPVYLLVPLNFACIWAGMQALGEPFLYRSATAFFTMGVVLFLVGPLDPVLPHAAAAIVGGAGVGFGVSLVVWAGGAGDGCEVLALIMRTRYGFPIPPFSFLFNTFVFGVVASCYGVADSFYSILAQGMGLIVMAYLLRSTR